MSGTEERGEQHLHWRTLQRGPYAPNELGVGHDVPPASTLAALHLPRRGDVYDLDSGRWTGMPVHPVHAPFVLTTYRTPQGVVSEAELEGKPVPRRGFTSELIVTGMHTGTHVDALSHIACGPDQVWHGGYKASEDIGDFGVRRADASGIPPFICRGVLADVAGLRGVDALPAGSLVTTEEVVDSLAQQKIAVERGDAVLIRTGYMRHWGEDAADRHVGAGIGRATAVYLADRGAVLVGADNDALEQNPATDEEWPQNPVHIELLINRGIHILELAYLEELARDEVYEFLFVCAPPRIQGATAAIARPLAIA
jgi:kynurenine formamidase